MANATLPPSPPHGKVYIGSMKMRGAWADRPEGFKTINVTSAQPKAAVFRRDFSPMSAASALGGYQCFENFWQGGKVYEGIPLEKSQAWWKSQTKGKRRYPAGKGRLVLCSNYDGTKRDYITSRKEVYVPLYDATMRATASFKNLLQRVQQGENMVVMDFDGPRTADGGVACEEVTLDLLRDKLADESFPFGHGYVVAAGLLGFTVDRYL